MTGPSCPEYIRDKPVLVKYNLIGNVVAVNIQCFRHPDIALGNIAAEPFFGGGNQFQCHYHRSQRSIDLETIEFDPHPHE